MDSAADPYDVLLSYYDPTLTTRRLIDLFADLRGALIPIVRHCVESGRRPDPAILAGPFPLDRQRWLAERAAALIGFDFTAGRLDTTTHPFFSAIGPGDVRITTRFRPDDFRDGLFATLHEVGHGLYEQNLPRERYGTPVGEALLAHLARIASPPLGEPGRPQPGVLGSFVTAGPYCVPGSVRRRRPGSRLFRRERRPAEPHPGRGRRSDLQPAHPDPV